MATAKLVRALWIASQYIKFLWENLADYYHLTLLSNRCKLVLVEHSFRSTSTTKAETIG